MTDHLTVRPSPLPAARGTACALLGSMLAIAVAESMIGDLDQATDIAAIAEGGGLLVAGGLTLLAAAILLGLAVAGLGPIVRSSVTGRIGWALLVAAVPCGGAFAMFHLLLAETGAAGLDRAAMRTFVLERFHGPGAWGLPVAYFALIGLTAVLLVLIALVRLGMITWWAPALFAAGILMEALLGDGRTEIASHWIMALAAGVAAYGLWRSRVPEPAPAA